MACAAAVDQLVGTPTGDDAAGLDESDPVAEALGLVGVVGDQQDGDAVVAQLLDEPPALPPGGRVEAGRQLVEDDEAGAADESEGDREPLLLPAGQLPVASAALFRQAKASEERLGVGVPWVEGRVQVDRLGDGDLVGQLALLELDADQLPCLGAVTVGVDAEHPDRAAVGMAQPLGALDGGGLARAVRAEDAEDLALLDAQAEVVDRDLLAVPLAQVADLKRDGAGPCHDCSRWATMSR